MLKLNIGCGNVPLPGFTNIDKYYYPGSTHPGMNLEDGAKWNTEMYPDSPWLYGDAVNLQFPDGTFDEVIMVHVLEHLSMNDGGKALREAVRVLKPGGVLQIEVPDLTKACTLFLESKFTPNPPEGVSNSQWFRIMGLLYGTQGNEGEGQFHLCGYSKDFLKFRMEETGLSEVKEISVGFGHGTREGGHGEPQYDFRLEGHKP